MVLLKLFYLILALATEVSIAAIDDQGAVENGQFHIQTDEGPERYFKYQTSSGQYRKEKILKDGTVIGSYGWVDANGYLRLRDYIADDQGYRITKSKMVYVGAEQPIGNALKMAKNAPGQAGIEGYPTNQIIPTRKEVIATTYRPKVIIPTTATYPTAFVSTTPIIPSTPSVYLSHNSMPSGFTLTPTAVPISTPIVVIGGKPSLEFEPPRTTIDDNEISYDASQTSSQYARPNSISTNYEKSRVPQRRLEDVYGRRYGGLARTRDGFQYYLRKQYHEEESNGVDKDGSFGYVDPFGIRRVIYYKASPEGFVHQKNNKYVGQGGTPYDSQPANTGSV